MIYDHDCDACIFLGQDERLSGEPLCNGVDLYICIQGRQPEDYCLIRRYSSEPSNYGAVNIKYASARYKRNIELWREQNG